MPAQHQYAIWMNEGQNATRRINPQLSAWLSWVELWNWYFTPLSTPLQYHSKLIPIMLSNHMPIWEVVAILITKNTVQTWYCQRSRNYNEYIETCCGDKFKPHTDDQVINCYGYFEFRIHRNGCRILDAWHHNVATMASLTSHGAYGSSGVTKF